MRGASPNSGSFSGAVFVVVMLCIAPSLDAIAKPTSKRSRPAPKTAKETAKSAGKTSKPPLSPAQERKKAAVLARKMAAEIMASVSKLRGLRIKRKLAVGVYNKAQLSAFVRKELTHGKAGLRLDHTGSALSLLGMAPPGYSLRQGIVDLLEEQVAGLYDPGTRQLRLMQRLIATEPVNPIRKMLLGDPQEETRVVMAHEIVHALQDQHFNLKKLGKDRPHNTDLEVAISSLVEGDATAAMVAWAMEQRGSGSVDQLFASGETMGVLFKFIMKIARVGLLPDTASLARSPRWLQDRLTVPYVDGLQMCMVVGKRHAFAAVDGLFRRPPLSSEQVLHPRKLLRQLPDHPILVSPPNVAAALGKGGKRLWHDVLGELGARAFFGEFLDEHAAEDAAAGWGGDRWVLYGKGKQRALVWVSTWDSDRDADEAWSAVQKWANGANRTARRKGRSLVALSGWPPKRTLDTARRLLGSTRFKPMKRLPK